MSNVAFNITIPVTEKQLKSFAKDQFEYDNFRVFEPEDFKEAKLNRTQLIDQLANDPNFKKMVEKTLTKYAKEGMENFYCHADMDCQNYPLLKNTLIQLQDAQIDAWENNTKERIKDAVALLKENGYKIQKAA